MCRLLFRLQPPQEHLDGSEPVLAKADFVVSSSEAMKASVRIHLFTLLCEEMKLSCARQLEQKQVRVFFCTHYAIIFILCTNTALRRINPGIWKTTKCDIIFFLH